MLFQYVSYTEIKDNPIPIDPDIHQETFACHDADCGVVGHSIRFKQFESETPTLGMNLKISNGFVQYQMQD